MKFKGGWGKWHQGRFADRGRNHHADPKAIRPYLNKSKPRKKRKKKQLEQLYRFHIFNKSNFVSLWSPNTVRMQSFFNANFQKNYRKAQVLLQLINAGFKEKLWQKKQNLSQCNSGNQKLITSHQEKQNQFSSPLLQNLFEHLQFSFPIGLKLLIHERRQTPMSIFHKQLKHCMEASSRAALEGRVNQWEDSSARWCLPIQSHVG